MAGLPIALGYRRRGRVAPAAGSGGGRRPALFPDPDPLRHPGLLSLYGQAAAVAQGQEEGLSLLPCLQSRLPLAEWSRHRPFLPGCRDCREACRLGLRQLLWHERSFHDDILTYPGGSRTCEAIAHSGLGEDVAGAGGVCFEFVAEVADVDPQHMGLFQIGRAPDLLENLAVGQDLAGVGDQAGAAGRIRWGSATISSPRSATRRRARSTSSSSIR